MSINYPKPHHGSTAEYQCSGVPFVTGTHILADTSVVKIHTPFVTRHFTITNSGTTDVRVGFTENGVNANPDANYFLVLGNTTTPRLEIKCQDIFVRKDAGTDPSQVFLVAGLTNVTQDRFFAITGSNGVEGVG